MTLAGVASVRGLNRQDISLIIAVVQFIHQGINSLVSKGLRPDCQVAATIGQYPL